MRIVVTLMDKYKDKYALYCHSKTKLWAVIYLFRRISLRGYIMCQYMALTITKQYKFVWIILGRNTWVKSHKENNALNLKLS